MDLVSQITSKRISRELKELGVKQDSQFYWWGNREKTKLLPIHRTQIFESIIDYGVKNNRYCSAFTVAELGRMLPDTFFNGKEMYEITFRNFVKSLKNKTRTFYVTAETYTDDGPMYAHIKDENEANARARMFIFLLKNKLVQI